MNGASILSNAYLLTEKKEATFLTGVVADSLSNLNICYGLRVLDILRVSVDKNATIQNAKSTFYDSSSLSEGQNGYNGQYSFPTNLLRPTRFEVSYDGKTWMKAKIYDNTLNSESEFNDTQINSTFSNGEPRVDFTRNSYKVRPLNTSGANIPNGLYIEYEKRQADFALDSDPSEIEPNLQNILAFDLASLEIIMHADKYTPTKITVFNNEKRRVEDAFKSFYENRLGDEKTMSFNFSTLVR